MSVLSRAVHRRSVIGTLQWPGKDRCREPIAEFGSDGQCKTDLHRVIRELGYFAEERQELTALSQPERHSRLGRYSSFMFRRAVILYEHYQPTVFILADISIQKTFRPLVYSYIDRGNPFV